MKKGMMVLVLAVMVFVAGCVKSDYNHKIYTYDGGLKEEWNVSRSMANVNQSVDGVLVKFSDGTVIYLRKNIIKSDPNSAKAEAELIGAIMSSGLTEVIK